jgi:Transglutaminase-like superfamily
VVTGVVSDYRRIKEVLDERWSLARKLRLALEIVPIYVRARWLLKRRGFETALAALRAIDRPTTMSELDQQLVGVRLGRGVERTLGPLPADSRCLIKSLVLTRLLARRGVDTRFIIGVRWAPNFQAHAWVEKAGIPLMDDGAGAYERLADL